jgi:hypothetical protein
MIIMMCVQYLAPMLAITLESYGYSNEHIRLTYALAPILYTISCPFIYLLSRNMHKRGIILIGLILANLSLLMIGGTDFLF